MGLEIVSFRGIHKGKAMCLIEKSMLGHILLMRIRPVRRNARKYAGTGQVSMLGEMMVPLLYLLLGFNLHLD